MTKWILEFNFLAVSIGKESLIELHKAIEKLTLEFQILIIKNIIPRSIFEIKLEPGLLALCGQS